MKKQSSKKVINNTKTLLNSVDRVRKDFKNAISNYAGESCIKVSCWEHAESLDDLFDYIKKDSEKRAAGFIDNSKEHNE